MSFLPSLLPCATGVKQFRAQNVVLSQRLTCETMKQGWRVHTGEWLGGISSGASWLWHGPSSSPAWCSCRWARSPWEHLQQCSSPEVKEIQRYSHRSTVFWGGALDFLWIFSFFSLLFYNINIKITFIWTSWKSCKCNLYMISLFIFLCINHLYAYANSFIVTLKLHGRIFDHKHESKWIIHELKKLNRMPEIKKSNV